MSKFSQLRRTRIDFGLHAGAQLRHVPFSYLKWFVSVARPSDSMRWIVEQYLVELKKRGPSGGHYTQLHEK